MIPRSTHSSSASATCRIEWRPSRWLLGALLLLTLLAPLAVASSELPRPAAWLAGVAAVIHGARLVVREAGRAPRCLEFTAEGRMRVDGEPVSDPLLQWRGPLAFARWRDGAGRPSRLAWWPDTLPPARRRALRLAFARLAPGGHTPSDGPSVAP